MFKLLCFLFFLSASIVSCNVEEEGCSSNDDCPEGYTCNLDTNICVSEESGNEEKKDDVESYNDADPSESPDKDDEEVPEEGGGIVTKCDPGVQVECYTGPSGTKGVGMCQAGVSTCLPSGEAWSDCEGEVLPQPEICGDDKDQNCDGQDWVKGGSMDVDIDGDGYTYCDGDCCEVAYECFGSDPKKINPGAYDFPANGIDENCSGVADSENPLCDGGITPETTDPVDMAKAMDICPVADDIPYGLISAEISFPDGTGVGEVPDNQYSVLSAFGNTVVPNSGGAFTAMSSGNATNPIGEPSVDNTTSSGSPQDWYQANGSKYPTPPDCGFLTGNSGDPANDPVMLKLKIKAPVNAEAFSFDIYFFSIEFHEYVCSEYNDFFVALVDSQFFSGDPELANPVDKNLAMDENGNPVGINLAMSGLFTVCDHKPMVAPQKTQFCQGSEPLNGTGFEGHGATGWLTTRGNIEPGEEFELRLAIWDAGDHVLDSLVIMDNWQWYPERKKPGTDRK